jgi:hypothetical protein
LHERKSFSTRTFPYEILIDKNLKVTKKSNLPRNQFHL